MITTIKTIASQTRNMQKIDAKLDAACSTGDLTNNQAGYISSVLKSLEVPVGVEIKLILSARLALVSFQVTGADKECMLLTVSEYGFAIRACNQFGEDNVNYITNADELPEEVATMSRLWIQLSVDAIKK